MTRRFRAVLLSLAMTSQTKTQLLEERFLGKLECGFEVLANTIRVHGHAAYS
jgi:hypothetical protein